MTDQQLIAYYRRWVSDCERFHDAAWQSITVYVPIGDVARLCDLAERGLLPQVSEFTPAPGIEVAEGDDYGEPSLECGADDD